MTDDDLTARARAVAAALDAHLPADDPFRDAPMPDGDQLDLVLAGGAVWLPDPTSGRRLTADPDGNAVVNHEDAAGGSVTVVYRDGAEIDRRRTGPPEHN